MVTHEFQKIVRLSKELSDALANSAYLAHELHKAVQRLEQLRAAEPTMTPASCSPDHCERPMLDQGTFSVLWRGKTLMLGHTRCFWLLARLARRPNQFVTHLDLLNDVWEDEELATATIRSTVCQLRRLLRRKRMHRLAKAIRGHNGHYILEL